MLSHMYCIFDTTAKEIFGGIMIAKNNEVARRAFHEGLANNDTLRRNAAEYNLIRLGAIDTETLHVNPDDIYLNTTATGTEWLEANKENNQ